MRFDARAILRYSVIATLVLGTPVVANAIIWRLLVAPQQARTQAWRDATTILDVAPALERLLVDCELALADWRRDALPAGDPARATDALRRLAGEHRVWLDEAQAQAAAEPADGIVRVPISAKVTGGFGKVARWISAVEAHPSLRIESVAVTPDAAGQSVAVLQLTALFVQT